jgi:hypothetical protein
MFVFIYICDTNYSTPTIYLLEDVSRIPALCVLGILGFDSSEINGRDITVCQFFKVTFFHRKIFY